MTRELITSIFGEYQPLIQTLTDENGVSVDYYVDGLAGVDWTYVLGVLGFFLVLYCVLRILGTVISRV